MRNLLFLLVINCLSTSALAQDNQADADSKAVHAAALNYINAIYEAKPELVAQSVSENMVKLGYYIKDGVYVETAMTYEELYILAETYNKDGSSISASAVKTVKVLDVSDKTSSVKVTADWGIDYIHLAKYDGKWKIIHVLWQSPPLSLN